MTVTVPSLPSTHNRGSDAVASAQGPLAPRGWLVRGGFVGLLVIGLATPFFADRYGEPYPAFMGPSFGRPLHRGDAVLVEDAKVWAETAQKRVAVKLGPLTAPVRAPPRFVVLRWLHSEAFSSSADRAWLGSRLESMGVRGAKRVVLQWRERPYGVAARKYLGPATVLEERVLELEEGAR